MKRKRKIAAAGTRKTKLRVDDAIAGHIADMSRQSGAISKSIASEQVALLTSLRFICTPQAREQCKRGYCHSEE